MALDKEHLQKLYQRRAGNYDWSANLYYLLGVREWHYRKRAVESLHLQPGDSVLEIGCGTGLNFELLQRRVGPQGKIIGLDLTQAMLDKAQERVRSRGWHNVELVRADAGQYQFPAGRNGIISTFVICLAPEYNLIIKRASRALAPGGRLAILDVKKPHWLPQWLAGLEVLLTRPFGVQADLAQRQPWRSVQKYLDDYTLQEFYLGVIYLATGTAPPS